MAAMDTLERPRSRRHDDDGAEAILRLDAHEEMCAYRYKVIGDQLGDLKGQFGELKKIIYGAAGTLILGMGSLIATLLMKGWH